MWYNLIIVYFYHYRTLNYISMKEWNGKWKKNLVWNGKFLVWNEYGMEEILQYGIWKNRLPMHSIASPAGWLVQLLSARYRCGRSGGLITGSLKSDTVSLIACHCCDVSSELG